MVTTKQKHSVINLYKHNFKASFYKDNKFEGIYSDGKGRKSVEYGKEKGSRVPAGDRKW